MLADYARLRITRHPVWPYHLRMWELRHNLGAYDAAYMALAECLRRFISAENSSAASSGRWWIATWGSAPVMTRGR
ncbi:MAG TPA: hypothetical protein VHO07_11255 [Streptosporangiaceae bacterium]|jgi:predicted nucleic acid-binding protein|nr:hypothetical protein [Streptosporangiaceae bacterium]